MTRQMGRCWPVGDLVVPILLLSTLDAAPAAALQTDDTGESIVRTVTAPIEAGTGGLEVDRQGRIYFADFGETLRGPVGTRVFRITPDGRVEVFADGLVGASGNAFDSRGRLLQSNIGGPSVSRIAPDGSVSSFAAEGLAAPVGIAVDQTDTAFVANCGSNTIRKITPDGASLPFAGSPLFRCPNGITMAPDGMLYVSNFGNGDVLRVTRSGEVSRFVTIPGGNNGHILAGNGILYVAARGANALYAVTLDGDTARIAGTGERGRTDGPALSATLSLPNDIALSPDGRHLYFNDVAPTSGDPSVIRPSVLRVLDLARPRDPIH